MGSIVQVLLNLFKLPANVARFDYPSPRGFMVYHLERADASLQLTVIHPKISLDHT